MKLTQHPEYQRVYLSNEEAAARCQEAVARWKVNNDSIDVPEYAIQWTYKAAQAFVQQLSQLFQAYNQVLWKTFHYCRQCGGQCCVVDASSVRTFDLLAIALLDVQAPVLPKNITARERECIYLLNQRCSWPEAWRTIKCWSFYCLGVGARKPNDSVGKLYTAITKELQHIVRKHIPDQLLQYEHVHNVLLTDYLDDPVRFSDELHTALDEIFVAPLARRYPIIDIQELHHSFINGSEHTNAAIDEVLATIAQIAEQVSDSPLTLLTQMRISPEEVLADLESLQWIVEGHPSNSQKMLQDIEAHYAHVAICNEREIPDICYRIRELIFKLSVASQQVRNS